MTTGTITMEREVLEIIAGAAAQKAAQEIVVETRAEIAEQFEGLRESLREEIMQNRIAILGRMDPSDHIIHHDRLRRGLKWFDETMGSLFAKVFVVILIVGVIGVALFAIAGKVFGH
jgi:hypothetical protein